MPSIHLVRNLKHVMVQWVGIGTEDPVNNPSWGYEHGLEQGSSTRGLQATCGPLASFLRPGKAIPQNKMCYE